MKKRALSLILALVLVVGLLPTVVFAAGGNEAEIVGGGQYATLQAAVDAADNGDTVRVLKDIAFEVPVDKLNCTDRQYYQPVHIIDKEIVLDFAGHTLTWCDEAKNQTTCNKDSWFTFFALENGADVMVTGNPRMETLVKDGMHSSAFWLKKDAYATLRIKDGYYYATDNVIFVYVGGGRVLIYGGTFENNSSKYGWSQLLNCAGDNHGHANGSMNDSKRITMYGGTLISADPSRMNDGNLVANGYEVQKNGTAYSVVPTEPVAEIVGGNQYATLQDAVDAAANGDTVKLLKDLKVTPDGADLKNVGWALTTIEGKRLTIDLDRHKIEFADELKKSSVENWLYAFFNLKGRADVTITGNGVLDGEAGETTCYPIIVSGDSILTIENGELYGSPDTFCVHSGCAYVNGGIYGLSTYVEEQYAPSDPVGCYGNIINTTGGASTPVTIKGGTFKGIDPRRLRKTPLYNINSITIAEGYIVRKDDNDYTVVPKNNLGAGVYTSDPTGFLAPGAELVDANTQGDGLWTVTGPALDSNNAAGLVAILDDIPFVDVDFNDYFYDSVKWAYHSGVTGGTDAWHFSPDAGCTRAQAVTFLWRAAGCPSASYLGNFADVDADAYYAPAVAWAVANGVTNGTSATTFSPEAACSRGDIVTFLYRAFGGTSNGYHPFADVPASAYYADAVAWAYEHGVTGGTSADQFSPADACSRAQIVTFLYRVLG